VVPIHAASHYLDSSLERKEVTATLMGLTMSAMPERSTTLWWARAARAGGVSGAAQRSARLG
jgi:hypothetical protein